MAGGQRNKPPRAGAGARVEKQDVSACPSLGTPPPPWAAQRAEGPYQFFKTRVVIRAAMTMMRDTVMVTI